MSNRISDGIFSSGVREVSKACFFEKKQQKTLGPAVAEVSAARVQKEQKFFGSFSKKELLALLVTG